MADQNAADHLEGLTLDTGWVVSAKVTKAPGATGGFFSTCYTATKDGEQGFLKAFNFARFLQLRSTQLSIVDVMSQMLDAYKYERDLSELCRGRRLSKVSVVRDSGEQMVPGFSIPVVPYLIFDVADGGDARTRLSFFSNLEASWKLRSLHSVAVGLAQLHGIDVSHQDLKPSNVLIFGDESKIGDLGRSTCLALSSPFDSLPFTGELSYAPPEILYGVHEPDWRKRTFSTDCYLFGSLVGFYFSGLTMTALVRKHLPDPVSWEHPHVYDDVKAYVLEAFSNALDEFEANIGEPNLRNALRQMVSRLCHPIPEKRSYTGTFGGGSPPDLERLVSRLDLLYRRAHYRLLR